MPGNGSEAASASTASRSARVSRRQSWMLRSAWARRQVPTISPATSTAPGHTREVHSSARRAAAGTRSSRPAPQWRKYVSPLGRRRTAPDESEGPRKPGSSRASIQASPRGVRTAVSAVRRASNAARASAPPTPAQVPNASGVAGPIGEPPEREDRVVAGRYDVRAEARTPDLNERAVFPRRGARRLHPRVDRKESRARNAVRQARPGREPERARAGWEPIVERADAPPEGEDLGPGELERGRRHQPPNDTTRPE
jgi:hypothetical protein